MVKLSLSIHNLDCDMRYEGSGIVLSGAQAMIAMTMTNHKRHTFIPPWRSMIHALPRTTILALLDPERPFWCYCMSADQDHVAIATKGVLEWSPFVRSGSEVPSAFCYDEYLTRSRESLSTSMHLRYRQNSSSANATSFPHYCRHYYTTTSTDDQEDGSCYAHR